MSITTKFIKDLDCANKSEMLNEISLFWYGMKLHVIINIWNAKFQKKIKKD